MGKCLGKRAFCKVREIDGTNIGSRDGEEIRCVSDNEVHSSTGREFKLESIFEVCGVHTYQAIDKSKSLSSSLRYKETENQS